MNKTSLFFLLLLITQVVVCPTSLTFDGSDDYVEVGSSSLYNISSYTAELWVYLNSSGRNYDPLFFKETGSSSDIELYGGNGLTVLHNRGNGGSCNYFYAAAPTGAQWVHVAISYNSSTQNLRLYYNGNLQTSYTLPNVYNTAGAKLHFGKSYWSSTLSGKLSEVRFWNVARTQAEILATKDINLQGNEAGLIGYWRMNEGAGSIVNDLTTNNNDGTIYGAIWNTTNPALTEIAVPEPSTFVLWITFLSVASCFYKSKKIICPHSLK